MRNNLSELKPLKPAIDGTTLLLGWQELESGATESALSSSPRWDIRPQVRMLGYMMDGDEPFREGAPVRSFLLLPDAGHILHPAHRDPDQMVKVTLAAPSVFRYRHLVWVSGTFGRTGKTERSREAMYKITNASVSFAADAEIVHWVRAVMRHDLFGADGTTAVVVVARQVLSFGKRSSRARWGRMESCGGLVIRPRAIDCRACNGHEPGRASPAQKLTHRLRLLVVC